MNEFEKRAQVAFEDELDHLFKLAHQDGLIDDPDFSQEKLAHYTFLREHLDDEGMEILEKHAMAQLSDFEKVALIGGLGKLLVRAGGGIGRAGTKLVARSTRPAKGFSRYVSSKGIGPEIGKSLWTRYQSLGPREFIRRRRMGRLVGGPLSGVKPQAQYLSPAKRQSIMQGPAKGKGQKSFGREMLTSAAGGAGFAGLLSLLGGEPEPEVQFGR